MRAAVLALALAACGGSSDDGVDLMKPPVVDPAAPASAKLSAYNFFAWDPVTASYTFNETGQRIVPYELNTPLFSDDAVKQRAIYVPPGETATFDAEAAFDFPVGSVLIKSFAFPADERSPKADVSLIETRLLVRTSSGWDPRPYIWNADQTDADYAPAGEVRPIAFTDASGAAVTSNYLIPQRNQCANCHGRQETPMAPIEILPIGIKARHLDREGQLTALAAAGMLSGLPDLGSITPAYDFRPIEAGGVAAIPPADVERAARTYLDINCAHCHSPAGIQGMTSQLFLNHDNTDAFHLGVCKRPGSAGAGTGGFTFDIVPGAPDTSILYFRVHTTQVGAMMPLLGRSLEHARGTELLHAWIAAMPAQACE